MVKTKTKPADILFQQMLMNDTASVAPLSYGMALWMNRATEDVSKQILGLAATLICMLQKYDLNHIAGCILFSQIVITICNLLLKQL